LALLTSSAVSTTYPPPIRVITGEDAATLASLKIQSSDILMLKQIEAAAPTAAPVDTAAAAATPAAASSGRRPTSPPKPKPASLDSLSHLQPLRVIPIPNDNSCLFGSIALLMEGAHSPDLMTSLREIVASIILADAEKKYDAAFLGCTKEEYAKAILKNDTWGGGIELAILAEYYSVEIAALDVETCHQYLFGTVDDSTATRKTKRIYTVYSGVHYDAMVSAEHGQDRRVFDPADETTAQRALLATRLLQQQGAFTNVSTFTLRCAVCQEGFVGAIEAQEHAKSTGHQQFEEYAK
jgi:ubiquitin thioesterase OTU1